jgi:broad specificity phosphatase PhoE
LIVRHGTTEPNAKRRFTGHSDVDLNPEGLNQVGKLRNRLAGEKIDTVYSSDLKRAVRTAEIICSGHGAEIEICPGDAEGLTYQEISERYPELGKFISGFKPELTFPNGEGFTDLTARADEFLNRIDRQAEDRNVLIVSHGGMLRTLVCRLLKLDQIHWSKFRFDNASLSIVDVYPEISILNLLNDTSHLEKNGLNPGG